jgi:hypothetical protein
MPAKIRKRFQEGMDILDAEVEEALVRGRGLLGTPPELHTLENWRAMWAKWRDVVLPKVIEYFPGTRPAACYIVGEIEPRPLQVPPPLNNCLFKVYIGSERGGGVWFHDYPEPYQRDEARHLRDLGIIDDAELKRYRRWMRGEDRREYPHEQGRYE